MSNNGSSPLVLWYNQLGMNDVDRVGGKNASLGEMITNLSGMGVSVPNGFATTADAFNLFLDQSGVNQRIYDLLDKTDIDDVTELAKAGAQIRQWIIDTPFQPELEKAIHDAYNQLSADDAQASFAVRSSATAEDMPDASFAGQQETFLNVQGYDAVLVAVKRVPAVLCLAVHGSRHLLSRAPGLRPSRRGALRWRAAHGALGRGLIRRDVLH